MKPAFHVYPGGLTGIALLVLRISIALPLVTLPSVEAPFLTRPALALDILAIAIYLGFYTRKAAVLACAGAALAMLPMRNVLPLPLIGQMLDAAVLAMLGPGALSIDARLFGRRTVRLPR